MSGNLSPDDPIRVFSNGEFLSADRASMPLQDRAVLFGETVFETVRAYLGRPFRLGRHLERLAEGCRELRLTPPVGTGEMADAVGALIEMNGLERTDARVRITVTGGPSTGPKGLERPGPSGIFITAVEYAGYPGYAYQEGISMIISNIRRNSSSPLSRIKSSNYLDSLLARQEALDRGSDDAVMLSTAGNLSEATSSNIFVVKGGEVFTPDVGCGLLPGITREAVIELCGRLGTRCTAVTEGPELLSEADEVFITSSMVEILPVREIAGRHIGQRCPGDVTAELSMEYSALVAEELGLA